MLAGSLGKINSAIASRYPCLFYQEPPLSAGTNGHYDTEINTTECLNIHLTPYLPMPWKQKARKV